LIADNLHAVYFFFSEQEVAQTSIPAGLLFASSLLTIGFLDVGGPLDRISSDRKNRTCFAGLVEDVKPITGTFTTLAQHL